MKDQTSSFINDKRIQNVLLCLIFMVLCYPSVVSALLRPNKRHFIRRFFSTTTTAAAAPTSSSNTTMNNQEQKEHPDSVGGGAINEKIRTYDETAGQSTHAKNSTQQQITTTTTTYNPSSVPSHLYHALEGLDRYPNYLHRWNMSDIDRLEQSLEDQLALVRQQRATVQERRDGCARVVQAMLQDHPQRTKWQKILEPCQTWDQVRDRILDARAAHAIFRSPMFRDSNKSNKSTIPSVQDVMNGRTVVHLDPGRLEALLDEELYDVYSFRLLSTEFCQSLREFVQELSLWSETKMPDSDSNNQYLGKRPFNLDMIGLGWVNDLLFQLVMRPIARHLFFESEQLQDDLDWRNGYIAGYSSQPNAVKPRERLVTHTDDSEVTMNICLGDVFQGGALEFRGLRGTPEEGQLLGTFEPQIGLALLHAGRHFHDVTQVTSGDRFAYIMWARSWNGIRRQKCPCCWLNRRQDSTCVCGSRWN